MVLLTNIVGVISLISTIIGMYFVSKKMKSGLVYYTVSLVVQLILFTMESKWFLVVQMLVLIASNGYVYWKWREDDVYKTGN